MNRRDLLTTLAGAVGLAALAPARPAAAGAILVPTKADADLWKLGYERGYANGQTAGYHEGWDIGERMGARTHERVNTPDAVVAGALYDFMGRLTTLDESLTVSRSHTVYALLDVFTAWAKERGLDINRADVEHWQERLA